MDTCCGYLAINLYHVLRGGIFEGIVLSIILQVINMFVIQTSNKPTLENSTCSINYLFINVYRRMKKFNLKIFLSSGPNLYPTKLKVRGYGYIVANNNNSCESHLCYTNIEWMHLSTQCLYLISFCTLPTPVIFRVEQEKSSLPSIFHFPFKNCNNSLHFHLICTSYIPFCFTTVSPFIVKSII